jgi:streptogramin lyase
VRHDTSTRKHAWIKLAAGPPLAVVLCLGAASPALAAGTALAGPGAFSVAASRPAPAPAFGGHRPGALSRPDGIAIGPDKNVWVFDTGRDRIGELSPAGTYLSSFPVATPYGVAVDGSGDVWVSSPSYAVQEFSAAGAALQDFNSTQSEYGALSNPAGIAVGPDGRSSARRPRRTPPW